MKPMEPPKDSTTATDREGEKPPSEVMFTIRHEAGTLRAVMDPPMFTTEPGYRDWMLLPRGGEWFRLGRMQDGELVEIMDFLSVQFQSGGAQMKGFEVRLPNDQLAGKGTRVP